MAIRNGDGAANTLIGTTAADTLRGDDGDDRLLGRAGGDRLFGGDDRDRLFGEAGDDVLYGQNGRDLLFAAAGDDLIVGGEGDDVAYGGGGADEFSDDGGSDRFVGGPGADSFAIDGDGGVERILDFFRAQGDRISLFDLNDERRDVEVDGRAAFDSLDTDGDDRLTAADDGIDRVGNALRLTFDDESALYVNNLAALTRSDFDFG